MTSVEEDRPLRIVRPTMNAVDSMRNKVVIGDVARLAGVSVPTVSRVLTGAAKVSDDKRLRVERAIETLNYRPSAAARALVKRQPRMIAVFAGDTSRYGYAETIRGIEERARAEGYVVSITKVEGPADDHIDAALSLVLGQSIGGAIVLKFDPAGVAVLKHLPKDITAVSISGLPEIGIPQALLDEETAARKLVTHLLSLGHRTVHHVRIPPSREEDGRTTGWRVALEAAGAEVPALIDSSWEPTSGRSIGAQLADRDDVTAVFCGNDEIAMGVIKGLADRGKRVPDDVSVAGFDDHPLAEMWSPSLTTVRQDFASLGARAFGQLLTVLEGGRPPAITSDEPTLVIRDSAGPPKGPSPRGSAAAPTGIG